VELTSVRDPVVPQIRVVVGGPDEGLRVPGPGEVVQRIRLNRIGLCTRAQEEGSHGNHRESRECLHTSLLPLIFHCAGGSLHPAIVRKSFMQRPFQKIQMFTVAIG